MKVEIVKVVYEGDAELTVFIDGKEVEFTEFAVDADAGWTRNEWDQCRADALAAASPTVRAVLEQAFADSSDSSHIR